MNANDICQIAVENGKLAIFGSTIGFLGEVIQQYTPFENEADAVANAKQKLSKIGRIVDPDIVRPFIRSMRCYR